MKLQVEIADAESQDRRQIWCSTWPARIGRRADAEIPISGAGAEVVSGEHANIALDGDALILSDSGSTNGTFLNGHRLQASAELHPDDEIVLGKGGARLRILDILPTRANVADETHQDPWSNAPGVLPSMPGSLPAASSSRRDGPVFRSPPISSQPAAEKSRDHGARGKASSAPSDTRQLLLRMASSQRKMSVWLWSAIGVATAATIALVVFLIPRDSSETAEDSDQGVAVFDRVIRGTLLIHTRVSPTAFSQGTGFLIDARRRLAVTNVHVIDGGGRIQVWFPKLNGNGEPIPERERYGAAEAIEAEVVKTNETCDLALIRLSKVPAGAIPLPLAAEPPAQGETLYTIGNPSSYDELLWIFSRGTVNSMAKKKEIEFADGSTVIADMIITDHPTTTSGSSGGPVVNADAEVVAINQSVGFRMKIPLNNKNSIDARELRELLKKYEREQD